MSWLIWIGVAFLVLAGVAWALLRFLGFCILSEWRDERDEW